MLNMKVSVDTSRLSRIIRNLPGREEENNRAIAFRIEGRAKAHSPVDTGANQSSIYTVTRKSDGYSRASSEAHSRNPDAETQPLPTPKGTDAHVGPAMEYSLYLEFGSRGRAPRPYLVPAVRETEADLIQQWGNIADE